MRLCAHVAEPTWCDCEGSCSSWIVHTPMTLELAPSFTDASYKASGKTAG